MKNSNFKLMAMLMVAIMSIALISCSKDDEDSFDYPMEQLYGRWKATTIKVDNKWYDVTTYPYTRFGMSITFYENGKFYGTGYLGTGSGTYKVKGKTITTYLDNKEYIKYTVQSLSSSEAHLIMSMGNESLEIMAKKQ